MYNSQFGSAVKTISETFQTQLCELSRPCGIQCSVSVVPLSCISHAEFRTFCSDPQSLSWAMTDTSVHPGKVYSVLYTVYIVTNCYFVIYNSMSRKFLLATEYNVQDVFRTRTGLEMHGKFSQN